METDLIVVRQLPIIEEQLRTVQENIRNYVADILAMECNEETYKAVKKARSELNAKFNDLEKRRKEVKRQIEEPYRQFDSVYKACVSDIFKAADRELSEKVNAVENGIRKQKEDRIRAYFEEYRESVCVAADFASYDRAGISVTMSASDKSLKAQAKAFIDKVKEDLSFIDTQELKDEILVEYQKTLSASQAIMAVNSRHAAIDRLRAASCRYEDAEKKNDEAREIVQKAIENCSDDNDCELQPPTVSPIPTYSEDYDNEKVYECCFRVKAPISKIRELKKFLIEGGYDYANVNGTNE